MESERYHGEYKVSGGKLVVADVRVTNGALSAVSISGDFFLEPDDALQDINAALLGLSTDVSARDLTIAVEQRLKPEVTMVGFSPRAVAIAVRRALGKATSWSDHEFDIIAPAPLTAWEHVAYDEILARQVGAGERRPTLRFWEWTGSAVILGSFQSVRNEVHLDMASHYGVDIVRRSSGGGAMFVEPGNAITYSLYVPQSLVDGMDLAESYPFLDSWVMVALQRLAIAARYVPLNDIVTQQGKIGGAAQKRFAQGGLLHHVTMSYDLDVDKMLKVLRIGREKIVDKGIASANKRVDPLRRQTGMSQQEILDGMLATFTGLYTTHPAVITDADRQQIAKLVESKFATEEWIYRLP